MSGFKCKCGTTIGKNWIYEIINIEDPQDEGREIFWCYECNRVYIGKRNGFIANIQEDMVIYRPEKKGENAFKDLLD